MDQQISACEIINSITRLRIRDKYYHRSKHASGNVRSQVHHEIVPSIDGLMELFFGECYERGAIVPRIHLEMSSIL